MDWLEQEDDDDTFRWQMIRCHKPSHIRATRKAAPIAAVLVRPLVKQK